MIILPASTTTTYVDQYYNYNTCWYCLALARSLVMDNVLVTGMIEMKWTRIDSYIFGYRVAGSAAILVVYSSNTSIFDGQFTAGILMNSIVSNRRIDSISTGPLP